MFLLKQLLPGVLVALVITGGLLVVAGRLWRASTWMAGVAIGLGYTGGHVMNAGLPALPPAEATHWLPCFALAAMLAAVLDALIRPPVWLRASCWFLLCAGLLRLLLQSKFQYDWSPSRGALWVASLAAAMLLFAACLEQIARPDARAASVPLIVAIVATGTCVALMLSGSILLGQLAAVLTAAVGASLLLALLLPLTSLMRGMVPVLAVLLFGLWVTGYFYAELPAVSAALLAAAPLLGLLIPRTDKLGEGKALLLRAGCVVIPVVISVILALRASPPME